MSDRCGNRPKPIYLGLTITDNGRLNYVRYNISHNSDAGALGNDPDLAAQPLMGDGPIGGVVGLIVLIVVVLLLTGRL